ncbi:histone deacetylase 8 [Amyelois transitella]|uniref:histone deacetylase 8 n=1 Tax=Amyelois transitella TaxID=680683 RepID=UPI00298FC663|nr:histone deacetylase 8 [Amyelois transitella]
MSILRCSYIWDENLISECDRLPAVLGRASMVHDLLTAYCLHRKMKVIRSVPASYDELRKFHSELYLDHLKCFIDVDEEYMTNAQDEEFGIGYDCPPVSNMLQLVSTVAGSSITAAKCLVLGIADVAINWCGGWHHAQRFAADGFCYVNDIVLAIDTLKQKFSKVLYIDLDVHHGNGVQDAFNLSKTVFTLSFHKFEPGFYPGTGSIDDVGSLTGKGYCANLPFHGAYSDDSIQYAFEPIFNEVCEYFVPDAIVLQCGADALAGDPHGGASLTSKGYCSCVKMVLDKRKPTVLLGGGGYNHSNTARLWTTITALVLGITLDEEIPEHKYWPKYGPGYMLHIEPNMIKDNNKKDYLDDCIKNIKDNINKYLIRKVCEGPVVKRKKIYTNSSKETIMQENNIACKSDVPENIDNVAIIENEIAVPKENHNNDNVTSTDVYDFID